MGLLILSICQHKTRKHDLTKYETTWISSLINYFSCSLFYYTKKEAKEHDGFLCCSTTHFAVLISHHIQHPSILHHTYTRFCSDPAALVFVGSTHNKVLNYISLNWRLNSKLTCVCASVQLFSWGLLMGWWSRCWRMSKSGWSTGPTFTSRLISQATTQLQGIWPIRRNWRWWRLVLYPHRDIFSFFICTKEIYTTTKTRLKQSYIKYLLSFVHVLVFASIHLFWSTVKCIVCQEIVVFF